MQGLARVALQPVAHCRRLVGCLVIQDRMDDLAGGDITLQGIQEAIELLMSVAQHIAGEDRAGEGVESGEQRLRSVALPGKAERDLRELSARARYSLLLDLGPSFNAPADDDAAFITATDAPATLLEDRVPGVELL